MVCRTLYVSSSRYVCLFLRFIIIMASCFQVYSVWFFSNSQAFLGGLFLSTGFMFRGVGQKSVFIGDYIEEIGTWAWNSPNFWEHLEHVPRTDKSRKRGRECGCRRKPPPCGEAVDKQSCRQRFLSREGGFFLLRRQL
uniref:Uncharacterized protein n=1 Tax=Ixodes ricinus TaxID=34613 RepID=A0A6B0UST7_IXORI